MVASAVVRRRCAAQAGKPIAPGFWQRPPKPQRQQLTIVADDTIEMRSRRVQAPSEGRQSSPLEKQAHAAIADGEVSCQRRWAPEGNETSLGLLDLAAERQRPNGGFLGDEVWRAQRVGRDRGAESRL